MTIREARRAAVKLQSPFVGVSHHHARWRGTRQDAGGVVGPHANRMFVGRGSMTVVQLCLGCERSISHLPRVHI
jgi:hypothetical protein